MKKTKATKKPPFALDPHMLADDLLLGRSSLVYPTAILTDRDARRRSVVHRTMTALGLGEYNVDRDEWTLDKTKVLTYLAQQYSEAKPRETLAHLASLHEPDLREQILAHFATPPETTT